MSVLREVLISAKYIKINKKMSVFSVREDITYKDRIVERALKSMNAFIIIKIGIGIV